MTFVALYQKDGSGNLIRMYHDRIFEPNSLSKLLCDLSDRSPALKCPNCKTLLGVPMVYKPENRLAFRLIRGAVYKVKSDGTFPPEKYYGNKTNEK